MRLTARSFDWLVLFLSLTGFTFVQEDVVPRAAWPLAGGLVFLGTVVLHAMQVRRLEDDDLAPTLGGIVLLTLGSVLLIDKSAYVAGMLLGLAVMLLAGLAWSAWRATVNQRQ